MEIHSNVFSFINRIKSELLQQKQNLIINQTDTWGGGGQKAISFDVCFIQYYCQLSKSVMEAIFVCEQAHEMLLYADFNRYRKQHLALWKFVITFTHA